MGGSFEPAKWGILVEKGGKIGRKIEEREAVNEISRDWWLMHRKKRTNSVAFHKVSSYVKKMVWKDVPIRPSEGTGVFEMDKMTTAGERKLAKRFIS